MTNTKRKGEGSEIDTKIYPLEVIQAAAYALTGRAFVRIKRAGGSLVSVALEPKASNGTDGTLADEFQSGLIHEALRSKIFEANQKIREYVVTKALITGDALNGVSDIQPAGAVPEGPRQGESRVEPQETRAGEASHVDEALEAEIEKLLAEIEKSEPGGGSEGGAVPRKKAARKKKAKAVKSK